MATIGIDRRAFFASLGGVTAVSLMSHEDRAEALEHYMSESLEALPVTGGAQYFPDSASLRISLSSVKSETAFLNRWFSFSSSFKRFA